MLVTPPHDLVQGEGHFIRMDGAPGNNSLELKSVVGNRADFHQLCFDNLCVSHGNSSMAQIGPAGHACAGSSRKRRNSVSHSVAALRLYVKHAESEPDEENTAHRKNSAKRTSRLFYELDETQRQKFDIVQQALTHLFKSERIWRVDIIARIEHSSPNVESAMGQRICELLACLWRAAVWRDY